MATGRTTRNWVRFYADGYDLSGYSRTVGPLVHEYVPVDLTADMADAVRGFLPGQATISPGTLNGLFDNTATSGLHAVTSVPAARVVMIPIGIRAAPAQGDPVFNGQFRQLTYQASEDAGAIVATLDFGGWDAAGEIAYDQPWGSLLHANSAATEANSATGIDDNAAASSAGGYMQYQVFAGNGTATITVEEASANSDGSFGALSGATSGEINCAVVQKGIVAIGTSAAVKRYLRWQISLNTATTVTFALSFVRGN